eukprot:gnl/TRDRNA2_/TRDRNA2_171562_c0_seq5.p1 gnl/TRDRNA2_/TRDRNA2_171562_c0~~gnl/TRDRNA2_/TRDRNA2_171562_c0_seq5.p1  ORF type:complete len:189 (-),score=49.19 gnl/TRDRNA2_/TRDRNA2_171562_c0_seq5:146-712(-)
MSVSAALVFLSFAAIAQAKNPAGYHFKGCDYRNHDFQLSTCDCMDQCLIGSDEWPFQRRFICFGAMATPKDIEYTQDVPPDMWCDAMKCQTFCLKQFGCLKEAEMARCEDWKACLNGQEEACGNLVNTPRFKKDDCDMVDEAVGACDNTYLKWWGMPGYECDVVCDGAQMFGVSTLAIALAALAIVRN